MNRFAPLTLVSLFIAVSASSAAAQTELVANGSLDSYDGSGLATSWHRWWEEVPNPNTGSLDWAGKPDWSAESNPALVLGGQSQHIGATWNPWRAGIYQTVSALPNTVVRITASGRAFASNDNFPTPSDSSVPVRMQIGADPNGGLEWWSGNVQWSAAGNPHDSWQTFTLEVTAGPSGRVTIFLAANYRGHSRLHLDAWWDNVSAQAVGGAPTATLTAAPATSAPATGQATSTAPPAFTETPLPEPSPTAAPATDAPSQPAVACAIVFEDRNGNGAREADEVLLPGSTISLDGGDSASANPACFENLAPGSHTLAASLPAGYFATTGDRLTIALESGQSADFQFGAQSSRLAQPNATATPAAAERGGADAPALIVVGVVVVVVLAIGAALGVVVWRLRT